jgi:TolB-like protein
VIAGGVGTAAVVAAGGWALLKPGSAAASNRIAVMSFTNMSGDPAQAYFSDGIAEELRGALSRVGMQVIGKASCDAVKDLEIPAAAAKLGVANILTGSVRRSPETIRIGAQLVNGKDGVEKWAQNYDRAPGDTIKIQTDIAAQVAGALSIALGTVKKAVLTLGGTADADAQDLYMQAQALAKSADSAEVFRTTISLLDAALARDPDYGDAHLGKAIALGRYGAEYAKSPGELNEWLNRADQSAKRGAALMPGSGTAIAMLAFISAYRLDFRGALDGFSKALAASPNDTNVLTAALNHLSWLADGPSTLPLTDRFIELDPLNPSAYLDRGICLHVLRRYEDSIVSCNKALALAPKRNAPRYYITYNLILLNRPAEARAVLAKLAPNDPLRQTDEAMIAARAGDRVGSATIMSKISAALGVSASYQYSQISAQLGAINEAFASLDKAVGARDTGLEYLKRDPFLDPIRGDHRYAALLQRLNFA